MVQTHRPVMTNRRLLLFKWLMILVPATTVAVGHTLLEHTGGAEHTGSGIFDLPTGAAILLVTLVGLVLTYIFVETLFRGIRRLQAEALAREQEIQTMNAVMQERERLSRELH